MFRKSFLLVLSLTAIPVMAQESAYTPLDLAKCTILESSENDPNAEIDYFTVQCPGREGYDVMFLGGDLRSWITLKKKGAEIYDARKDVLENAPGGFPHISSGVLEWRYDAAKKLKGLIFRIAGQDMGKDPATNPKDVSTLFVIRHHEGKFCFLGTDKTNEGARRLADGGKACTQ